MIDNPFIEQFETHLQHQDCSETTISGYTSDLGKFATWFEQTNGEALAPQAITPIDLREYRQYMQAVERHKASTVNRRLAAIKAFVKWAKQSGLIEHDPTENVRNVSQVNAGPKYLDKFERFALKRATEKDVQLAKLRYPRRWLARQRDASLVETLTHTGLRLSEALSLRLDDIELSDRKGQIIVRQGKGGKQRVVPLNSEARKALQAWLAVRPDDGSDFLWIAVESESKGALSSRSVQRVVLRLGQDAGIAHLTPHMLRHTFAKSLVDSGVGLEKVAALLGHSSLNTTRVYVTPNLKDLEKAVEELADQTT